MILDEPTDGLDPAGIHEMRRLLAGMAHEGGRRGLDKVWVAAPAATRTLATSVTRDHVHGRWRRAAPGLSRQLTWARVCVGSRRAQRHRSVTGSQIAPNSAPASSGSRSRATCSRPR